MTIIAVGMRLSGVVHSTAPLTTAGLLFFLLTRCLGCESPAGRDPPTPAAATGAPSCPPPTDITLCTGVHPCPILPSKVLVVVEGFVAAALETVTWRCQPGWPSMSE